MTFFNIVLMALSIAIITLSSMALIKMSFADIPGGDNTIYVSHGSMWLNVKLTVVIGLTLLALSTSSIFALASKSSASESFISVAILGSFTSVILVLHLTLVSVNEVYLGTQVTIVKDLNTFDLSDPFWMHVQTEYQCCGIRSYHDWNLTYFGSSGNVPDQCCVNVYPGCGQFTSEAADIHDQGCKDSIF